MPEHFGLRFKEMRQTRRSLECVWTSAAKDALLSGKPELKNPDAAFIGFCKSRHNKHPMK
jgi:hypothetical protein